MDKNSCTEQMSNLPKTQALQHPSRPRSRDYHCLKCCVDGETIPACSAENFRKAESKQARNQTGMR